jgi:hypothetical protein
VIAAEIEAASKIEAGQALALMLEGSHATIIESEGRDPAGHG